MLKKFIKKYQYIIFSIVGVIVVLWQILLPGYILLLDWVSGPHNIFPYHSLASILSAPSNGLLYLLRLVFPAWVVQKFIFFGMFFILFYFPLRFYPFKRSSKEYIIKGRKFKFETAKYFASLLFVFNPFVYERVLAGQWRVVIGYAFMFPLVYYILSFTHRQSWRVIVGIFSTLLITGMWSVHFLAVGIVITGLYLIVFILVYLSQKKVNFIWKAGKKIVVGAVIFSMLSCYWIVPYKLQGQKTLEEFGVDHWQAFATASDEHVGVIGNVITLRGFWGEAHSWENQFEMPWDNTALFYSVFVVILLLSVMGLRTLWQKRLQCQKLKVESCKINRIFISILFMLSVVFATGVSAFGLWVINEWLFENIGFWSGFRDSQKWSGVTALMYVLLSSVGVDILFKQKRFIKRKGVNYVVQGVVLLIPILLVPQMLFGFSGQIKSVWYPDSWKNINTRLQDDKQCRMLFLPWHQYYSVKLNNGMLVANPSHRFFDCEVIAGRNTELGNIKSVSGGVENYDVIEKFIMSNDPHEQFISNGIHMLRQNEIEYIIFTNDLIESDLYKYKFLQSDELEKVIAEDGVVLYKIKKRY